MPSWPGVFQFGIFLGVALSVFRCMFAYGPSCSDFFFHVFYPFSISVMFFPFPYFTPFFFCFSCIRFLICPDTFFTILFVEFLLLFWKAPLCLYCMTLSQYLLSLLSFANIFWFISSNCVIRLVCYCLFGIFSFYWVPVRFTFLSSFDCCRSFFICPCILLSHPDFVFLFRFLWEILIVSLINFAPE